MSVACGEYDQLLAEAASDPRFLPVLADWLEDNGFAHRAECLRWCAAGRKRPLFFENPGWHTPYWMWSFFDGGVPHSMPPAVAAHYPRTEFDTKASWVGDAEKDASRRHTSLASAFGGLMGAWERARLAGWEGER